MNFNIIKNVLRIILLIMTIVLIFDPVFNYYKKINVSEETAILIDISKSVNQFQNKIQENINKFNHISRYYFAKDLYKVKNEDCNTDFSNIIGAVNKLGMSFKKILIITDGNSSDKIEKLNINADVYTVGVGLQEEYFDVELLDVEYKSVIKKDEKVEFLFRVNLNGADEKKVYLKFLDTEKEYVLSHGLNEIKIVLNVLKDLNVKAGIIPLNNEKNIENNYKNICVKCTSDVLKSVIYQTDLNMDAPFLKRALKKIGDVKLISDINKDGEKIDLQDVDILVNFDVSSHKEDVLKDFIEKGGLYIFFNTKNFSGESVWFSDNEFRLVEGNISVNINNDYASMPYFNLKNDIIKSMSVLDRLLYFDYKFISDQNSTGEDIMFDSDKNSLITCYRRGRGSIIHFKTGPFFKVSLNEAVSYTNDKIDVFNNFFVNIIESYSNDIEKIQFAGLKKSYFQGEMFNIKINNMIHEGIAKNYINNVYVGNGSEIQLELSDIGEYNLKTELFKNNILLTKREEKFFIYTPSGETQSSINTRFLKELNTDKNEKIYSLSDIDELVKKLMLKNSVLKSIKIAHTHIFIALYIFIFSLYLYIVYKY